MNTGAEDFKIGVIGDLHIDDRQVSRYDNYMDCCVAVCESITNIIIHEKLTHLILLGDIVGASRKHVFASNEARLWFFQILSQWNTLLNGNVYSICGNHDKGSFTTDFDLALGANLLKHPEDLLLGGYKFHFIDYGDDTKAINVDNTRCNVVLMHSYLKIEGKTSFIPYGIKNLVELSDLKNLKGCQLVLAGHLHNPSCVLYETSIEESPISLFYPGCPMRPTMADTWVKTHMYVCETKTLENNDYEVCERIVEMQLPDKAKLLRDVLLTNQLDTDEEESESISNLSTSNVEKLTAVLNELRECHLTNGGAYEDQLKKYAILDKPATDLVSQYIEKAASIATCKK